MFIPGRIEFLGKHTDYCGGQSIVCAIDRGFTADVSSRSDSLVSLKNLDSGETASFDLAVESITPQGHWTHYAAEVGRRLVKNFNERARRGADIRFTSDLPIAAGLSSSSALVIMVYGALERVNDLRGSAAFSENIKHEVDLAEYLGCIENGLTFRGLAGTAGVGTFGGSQDHAAILLGRSGKLTQFSFAPLTKIREFSFPPEYSFVVASSGVAAEKTGAALEKYNRVSRIASDITTVAGGRSLARTIEELGIDEVRKLVTREPLSVQPDELLARLDQFYAENFQIIPAVCELLSAGRLKNIGELVDASHNNAERLLGNQIEESIFLQRSAREIGALAASAFGAGFGGSVYALLPATDAEDFSNEWRQVYARRFPQQRLTSEFFVASLSQCEMT